MVATVWFELDATSWTSSQGASRGLTLAQSQGEPRIQDVRSVENFSQIIS